MHALLYVTLVVIILFVLAQLWHRRVIKKSLNKLSKEAFQAFSDITSLILRTDHTIDSLQELQTGGMTLRRSLAEFRNRLTSLEDVLDIWKIQFRKTWWVDSKSTQSMFEDSFVLRCKDPWQILQKDVQDFLEYVLSEIRQYSQSPRSFARVEFPAHQQRVLPDVPVAEQLHEEEILDTPPVSDSLDELKRKCNDVLNFLERKHELLSSYDAYNAMREEADSKFSQALRGSTRPEDTSLLLHEILTMCTPFLVEIEQWHATYNEQLRAPGHVAEGEHVH